MVVYIRKVKKSESKSQHYRGKAKAFSGLCISVKLKNLKANHNLCLHIFSISMVVYIRKVKKSESKSQPPTSPAVSSLWLCISVKLKNLKANHNIRKRALQK